MKDDEESRQACIVEYVRTVAPQILIWAVPNGGWRSKREAGRMKWTGTLAGVLDLTLALPDGRCSFWETKTQKGRLSDKQKDICMVLRILGHDVAVVRSVDDARRELKRLNVRTRETDTWGEKE